MKTLLIILTVLGAIVGFGYLTIMLTSSANPTHIQKLIPFIALGVSIISTLIQLDTSTTEIVEHLNDIVKLRRKLDDRLVEIIELQRVIKEMKIEKIQYQVDNKLPPVFYPDNLVASSDALDDSAIHIFEKSTGKLISPMPNYDPLKELKNLVTYKPQSDATQS